MLIKYYMNFFVGYYKVFSDVNQEQMEKTVPLASSKIARHFCSTLYTSAVHFPLYRNYVLKKRTDCFFLSWLKIV